MQLLAALQQPSAEVVAEEQVVATANIEEDTIEPIPQPNAASSKLQAKNLSLF